MLTIFDCIFMKELSSDEVELTHMLLMISIEAYRAHYYIWWFLSFEPNVFKIYFYKFELEFDISS